MKRSTDGFTKSISIAHPGWAILAVAGCALLLFRVVLFAQTGLELVAWPWQFDYDEGVNLNATVHLAEGRNIYRPNGPESFLSAPYPPVFYLLNVPAIWLAGPTFCLGRAISLLSTITIAGLTAYIVWRATRMWAVGLLSGVLWLSLSPVIVWSSLYKQDMPALALGLAGLAWALTFPEGRRLYIAAGLFALAFYTKQSAVTAAAATTLWLLIRSPRDGFRFGVVLGTIVLVPFGVANLLSKGGLWEHIVTNHALPWSPRRFGRSFRKVTGEYWPLITLSGGSILALLAVALDKGSATDRNDNTSSLAGIRSALGGPWGLVGLYAVAGIASSLVQMGYEGANYNHLLDGLLPMCMLSAWPWTQLKWGERVSQKFRSAASMAVVAAFLLVQVPLFRPPQEWYRGSWPGPVVEEEMRRVSNLVRQTPGDIFSEDAYVLLSNGRRVLYDDPSTFVPLAERGAWDDNVFNRSIRERRFPLVLQQHRSGRWTKAGFEALHESYQLKFRGGIDIFEAKLATETPQTLLECALSAGDDAVALTGYNLAAGVAHSGISRGEILRAALYWRAENRLRHDYVSYLHVLNQQGERVASIDKPLTNSDKPTSQWQPGASVVELVGVHLPPKMEPGRYRLIAGTYRPENGQIMPLTPDCSQGGEHYGTAVSLGWIEVK